jgi:hypothetical protein
MHARFYKYRTPLVGTLIVTAMALAISWFDPIAGRASDTISHTCTSSPARAFSRTHFGLWNWCQNDSYGPPEYSYWNYYPGTPGYNNPGAGPYYADVAAAISRWYGAQSNYVITYQSGDWNNETDGFLWAEELDPYFPTLPSGSVGGWVRGFYCTSSSSCTESLRSSNPILYNLVYMAIDDDPYPGIPKADVITHEFGHWFGLRDVSRPFSCTSPHLTLMAAGCTGYPASDDVASVNIMYPDP